MGKRRRDKGGARSSAKDKTQKKKAQPHRPRVASRKSGNHVESTAAAFSKRCVVVCGDGGLRLETMRFPAPRNTPRAAVNHEAKPDKQATLRRKDDAGTAKGPKKHVRMPRDHRSPGFRLRSEGGVDDKDLGILRNPETPPLRCLRTCADAAAAPPCLPEADADALCPTREDTRAGRGRAPRAPTALASKPPSRRMVDRRPQAAQRVRVIVGPSAPGKHAHDLRVLRLSSVPPRPVACHWTQMPVDEAADFKYLAPSHAFSTDDGVYVPGRRWVGVY